MKALEEMNNVEKAYVLAKLFPDNLKELIAFTAEEAGRFRKQEKHIRSIWTDSFITADFWYNLLDNVEGVIKRNNVMLHKSPRVFSDQLFDGYNALFLIYSLIKFSDQEACNQNLKQAIHLLFGDKQILSITLEN